MDLISVIIPVYNAEKYLQKSIESVVDQTYKNIELILVNDGSSDNSGEICRSYEVKDTRIKLINTDNNGPAAARNTGIDSSKGDFIYFLDADDYLLGNNAFELLLSKQRDSKADIVASDFKKVNGNNTIDALNNTFPDDRLITKGDIVDYSRNYLKKPNKCLLFAFSWGRLFRSSIIKEHKVYYDRKLSTFEDVAFNFDCMKYVNSIYYSTNCLYAHTIYDNYSSATMTIGNNPYKLLGYRQALTRIGNYLINSISESDIKKETAHADVTLTIIQLVRVCGQIGKENRKGIYNFINEVVSDKVFRSNLPFYSPEKGNSRLLPVFIKFKLIRLIMWLCSYKARKRYKRSAVK